MRLVLGMLVASFAAPFASAAPVFVHQGQDRGNPRFACQIEIQEESFADGLNQTESLVGRVNTNYSHDGAAPSEFRVTFSRFSPDGTQAVFEGQNGQDVLRVIVPAVARSFAQVDRFDLRWLHGDHFHTNTCLRVTRVQ